MPIRKFKTDDKAYAIYRSGLALDRLVRADSPAGKQQASRWAAAWYVAAGGKPPGKFRLRDTRKKA